MSASVAQPRAPSPDSPNAGRPEGGGRVGSQLPDISVVMATCNRPHTITESIRSALDQQGAAVEVIVVDDSPDGSAAATVAELDDSRIRYLTNEHPSGGRPAVPRNFGAAFATGALVHFLDDDDIVVPGHYAACLAAFAARPAIGVVFGTIEPFGEDSAEIARQRAYFEQATRRARRCARLGSRWAFTAAMLFGPTLLVCSAGMVRREHVHAVGGFDTAMPLVEDVDFFMRTIRHAGAHFLDRPALQYRVGPSLMRQPGRDRLIEESYRLGQARYRRERGSFEFTVMRILAKGGRLT